MRGDPERHRVRGRDDRAPDRRRSREGGGERIRCPRCGWEPRASDRWGCTCGHVWNTFETRGECPGCGRRWEETQCLRCGQWSRHRSWYVRED